MAKFRNRRTRQPRTPTEPGLAARDSLRDTIRLRHHLLSTFRYLAASDPPIEWVLAQALNLARDSLRAQHCAYAARSATGEGFRLMAGIGWAPGLIGSVVLRDEPGSLAAHTVLVGGPVIVEDLQQVHAFAAEATLADHGMRSTLTAPVRGQLGSTALLGVFSSTRRLFTPDEAEFLWGLAGVISAAVYRVEWRKHARTP